MRPFPSLAAALLVSGTVLIAAGDADAAPSRPIPAEAKKYTASFSTNGAVRLGSDTFWLSPGAQIRDADNRIVLPSHLRGEYRARALFEQGLRELVPAREIQIRSGPAPAGEGEAVYFTVPTDDRSQPILQVTFDPDYEPSADELSLLKAAASLAERPWLRRDVFAREPTAEGVPPDPNAKLPVRVTLWELMSAFRTVLARAQPDPVHQVEAEPVSLRERIGDVLRTLGVARRVTFDSLFGETPRRGFVIVTFLAVLELAKLGAVQAVQEEALGPILIVLAVEDVRAVTIDLLDEYEGIKAPDSAPSPDE